MSRFELIVFDLDGTLVDSRRDLADSVNALLSDLGHGPLDQHLIGTMVGDGARQLVDRAIEAARVAHPPADALERFLEHYDRRLLAHTAPYEGVIDMLEGLEARGIRRAVLTNKPQAATERVLEGLALRPWFDAGVIGAEGDFPRKPAPAGLLALAARAGVPIEATLLVGDGGQDVQTARRAGARICGARYGFGFPTAVDLLDESDWILGTPMGLLALLQP